MGVPGMNARLPSCLRTGVMQRGRFFASSIGGSLATFHAKSDGEDSYSGGVNHVLDKRIEKRRWAMVPRKVYQFAHYKEGESRGLFHRFDFEIHVNTHYPELKDVVPECSCTDQEHRKIPSDIHNDALISYANDAYRFWYLQHFPTLCTILSESTEGIDIVDAAVLLYEHSGERIAGPFPLRLNNSQSERVWNSLRDAESPYLVGEFLRADSMRLFATINGYFCCRLKQMFIESGGVL